MQNVENSAPLLKIDLVKRFKSFGEQFVGQNFCEHSHYRRIYNFWILMDSENFRYTSIATLKECRVPLVNLVTLLSFISVDLLSVEDRLWKLQIGRRL